MSQQQQLYRYHTALFCTVLLLYATLLFSSRTAFYSYSDNKVIRIKFMISLRIIMSLGAFYIVQGFTMSTSNPFFVTNDFLHLLVSKFITTDADDIPYPPVCIPILTGYCVKEGLLLDLFFTACDSTHH